MTICGGDYIHFFHPYCSQQKMLKLLKVTSIMQIARLTIARNG